MYAVKNNLNGLYFVSILLLFISIVFLYFTGSYLVFIAPLALLYLFIAIANWKLAYWIFIFCIPLSVQFGITNSGLSLSLPDEPICWFFLAISVLLIANNPEIIPRWWVQNPIALLVTLQLFWLIVAVCFSTVFLLSLKFLIAKIWYLVCFFILPVLVFKTKKDFKTGFLLFLFSVSVTMIIIFYRQILNGFSFAAISNAVGFLYLNHVEYAAVISIFFPLFFVTYIATAGMNKYIRLLLLSALCFFLIAVFFSYARAAIAAIIFSLLIGSAVRKRKVNFIMPVFYAVIAIVLFVLANDKKYLGLRPDYRHTFMHSGYADHIKATLEGRDVSSMERLYRWVAAIRMSNDRPITGFGPHGFVYHYKEYALPIFKTYSSTNKEHSTTHNYFLYMLTEQGWPAMLLYAILIMVVFYQAQNTYHRFNDRFYKYCTLGLVMAFAAAFVNNFFSELIETHKVGALFYLILSLLIVLDKKSREPVNL